MDTKKGEWKQGINVFMLVSILAVSIPSGASGASPVIQQGSSTNIVISEDEDPVAFALELSATDADSDPLYWNINLFPTNGSAATSPTTGEVVSVEYDPDADFHGSDTFRVVVDDGLGGTDEMMVHVSVEPVNDPPFLLANAGLQINQLEQKTITAALLAAGDVDTNDMSSIYFELGSTTRAGQLLLDGVPLEAGDPITQQEIDDGLLSYSVGLTEHGFDDFSFSVYDAEGAVASDGPWTVFTFPIIIHFTNVPPATHDDSGTTGMGTELIAQFSATDSNLPPQNLTYRIVQNGTHGHAYLLDTGTGSFSYTPTNNQECVDEIHFQVNDGFVDAPESGVFTISVYNRPPQAYPLAVTSVHGRVVSGMLQATDPDLPSQALTFELVENGSRGTAALTDPVTGAFTYTPAPGRFGHDGFSFRVSDGTAYSSNRPVDIAISHIPVDGDLLIARKLKLGDDTRIGSVLVADATTGDVIDLSLGDYLLEPNDVVFHQQRLSAFVADGNGSTPPRVIEIDLFDGNQRVVSEGGSLGFPFGINVDGEGNLLVCDIASASVLRIDPETGAQNTVATGGEIQVPANVQPLPDGSMYIIDAMDTQAPDGKLILLETNGTQTVVSTNGNLVVPVDLALGGTGTVFVTDLAGMVIEIDTQSGNQSVVASGLSMPIGIDSIDGQNLFISTSGSSIGQLLRMDAATHTTNALGSEIANADLWGLAIVPAMGWIRDYSIEPEGFSIAWHSPSGQTYRVESSTNLVDGAWEPEVTVMGNGDWISRTVTNTTNQCLFLRCVPIQQ